MKRLELTDAYKGYTADQDKLISPEETLRRFREKLSAVNLDILRGTVRIDKGRLGIPVYFSLCGQDAEEVTGTRKQMGKGGTPDQAEASAVMELAERFSFFSFSRNPANFLVAEYGNIEAGRALPFESIALSVHDESEDLDAAREIFAGLPLKWTRAYNLTARREVLLPFDWFYAINAYNGPSAGNCVEEAILQGTCEVVERHVSSLISRNRLGTAALRVGSAKDPLVLEMIEKYQRVGVRLFVSDFSLDTGIPSVGVLAYDPATYPDKSEIVWTAGTAPNPEKALGRALTEVAQLAGDFESGAGYVASGLPKFKDLAEAQFVIQAAGEKDIGGLPDLSDDNMKVEIERCVAALSGLGLEIIVIDVTHPGLGIPALYTVIPGAHFRERAAGASVGMFAAKLVAESGNPRWAITRLREMDERMPDKYYTKFYLGSCHAAVDEPERALEYFEGALGLAPREQDVASIYSYMGMCLKDLRRYRRAIRVLKKAEGHDRERTDIPNLMGFCHFKLKEHGEAIDCFKRVLELDPGSAIDYANIASNYRDMGDKERAIEYYRVALELDPTIDFARNSLSKLQGEA